MTTMDRNTLMLAALASVSSLGDILTDAPECAASVAAAQNLTVLARLISKSGESIAKGLLRADGEHVCEVDIRADGWLHFAVPADLETSGREWTLAMDNGSEFRVAMFPGECSGDETWVLDEAESFYDSITESARNAEYVYKMQETLNTFTKIVRNLDPQKRENLSGEITRVTNALTEAAHLMECIADAAQKAGIYNGQVDLTTPHLKMLLDDMASSCAPGTAEAQALGFDSVEQAEEHVAWLQANRERHSHAVAYQSSAEASERRTRAGVPMDTWVDPSNQLMIISDRKLSNHWNAQPGKGQEIGRVVALSNTEIIQDAGRGRHVVWDRKGLKDQALMVGEMVTINENGAVTRDLQRGDQSLGR